MKNTMEIPPNLKNKNPAQSSNAISGYLPKKKKKTITNSEGYMHPYVHCSIIYNRQDMKET